MASEPDFDYRTATKREILDRAAELPGLVLGDIPGATFAVTGPERGRQEAGLAIEFFFGIPPNSRAEADFPGAGIELKSVPLIEKSVGIRVDQRTVITQINYFALAEEDWDSASVRTKLNILFVFFERLRGHGKGDWPIRHVTLWQPNEAVERGISQDWERVKAKVAAGQAHELSESDGRILGPCTKGVDGNSLRAQPFSDDKAKPRAWALKPPFVLGIYEQSKLARPDFAMLAELSELTDLVDALRGREGTPIDHLATELGRQPNTAKDYAARVVHNLAKTIEPRSAGDSAAFPSIKAPRTTPTGIPYEAVSFPSFRHYEVIEEEWEDSLLLSYLEHLLFIPVIGASRSTPQGECLLGPPLYWKPTASQLADIEQEWLRFRDLIAAGQASQLPKASETDFIHVRPHGKDATDRDTTPGGGDEVRKSFWLNRPFVAEILSEVFAQDSA